MSKINHDLGIVVPIIGGQKNVTEMVPEAMSIMAAFHEVAQKYGFGLYCPKCMSSIGGQNNGHERYLSIACSCTEWRAHNPGRMGTPGISTRPS